MRADSVVKLVGFLVVLEFCSGVLQAWISPLLPAVLRTYGTTAAELNWVSAAYLLSTALCVPLLSALGDRYGHRRMLVLAAALVAAGSILVAVAPTFGVLLLGRVVQGPLGAFLPLEFAIVRERAGDRSGRAIGLLIGGLSVGGGVGFVASGLVGDRVSLSAALWVPALLLILAVPGAAFLVPETTARRRFPIDWLGAGLLGVGLVLLLAAVGNGRAWGWGDVRTVVGLAGGMLLLGLWITVERRTPHPLVDVSLVVGGALSLPLLAGLFYGAELYGSQVAVALFLGLPASTGVGLGLTAGQLGLVLLAFAVASFLGTVAAPRLAERRGRRAALLVGALSTAAGYLLTVAVHDAAGAFVLWQILVGFGNGLVLATLSTLVVTRAPGDAVAVSSGLFNTARTIGGAVAGAVFAAIMASLVVHPAAGGKPVTSESGFEAVWVACAVLALTVAGIAVRLRDQVRPADRSTPTTSASGTEDLLDDQVTGDVEQAAR